jgi:hypothetical protein
LRFKIVRVADAPTRCLNSRALSTCITHLAGALMPIAIIAEKLLGFPGRLGSLKSPPGRAPNTLPAASSHQSGIGYEDNGDNLHFKRSFASRCFRTLPRTISPLESLRACPRFAPSESRACSVWPHHRLAMFGAIRWLAQLIYSNRRRTEITSLGDEGLRNRALSELGLSYR